MATGLEIFYNLDILMDKVRDIIANTVNAVGETALSSLDVSLINKQMKGSVDIENSNRTEVTASEPQSAVRRVNEPIASDTNSKVWVSILWKSMEKMTDDLYNHCVKVCFENLSNVS